MASPPSTRAAAVGSGERRPLMVVAGRRCVAVAKSRTGRAAALSHVLPLCQALGDDLRRFGRRLAHVRIFGDLALDPLAFVLQVVAQGLQLDEELLNLQYRRSGNALDQGTEI